MNKLTVRLKLYRNCPAMCPAKLTGGLVIRSLTYIKELKGNLLHEPNTKDV